jgi:hypothetical protein
MKDQRLPADHHLLRYIKPSQIVIDPQDETLLTILGDAFRPRENDHGELSTTWIEYFPGSQEEQIITAVHAIRASKLTPRPNGGFALGCIEIIRTAAQRRKHSIRIVHDPADDNHAHAAVKRMPSDDEELLRILASEAWSRLILNRGVPDGRTPAPTHPCQAALKALQV